MEIVEAVNKTYEIDSKFEQLKSHGKKVSKKSPSSLNNKPLFRILFIIKTRRREFSILNTLVLLFLCIFWVINPITRGV